MLRVDDEDAVVAAVGDQQVAGQASPLRRCFVGSRGTGLDTHDVLWRPQRGQTTRRDGRERSAVYQRRAARACFRGSVRLRPFTARACCDRHRDEYAECNRDRPATPTPRSCMLALAATSISTREGGQGRRVEWVVFGHSGTRALRAAPASRRRLNPDVRPGETSLSEHLDRHLRTLPRRRFRHFCAHAVRACVGGPDLDDGRRRIRLRRQAEVAHVIRGRSCCRVDRRNEIDLLRRCRLAQRCAVY